MYVLVCVCTCVHGCLSVCVPVHGCLYVCVPVCMGACRNQKRASKTAPESEMQAACKLPDVGAETELRSSGRAVSAPNLGAISLPLGGL